MKIKFALVALALSSVVGLASANTTNVVLTESALQPGSFTGGFFTSHFTAGEFTDTFNFGFPAGGYVDNMSISSFSFMNFIGLDILSAKLNGTAVSSNIFSSGGAVSTQFGTNGLPFTGPLSLVVTGMTYSPTSTYGGGITLTPSSPIPSPVPEPETYAMMLAGLGLLGFAARRKAKANQA
ncbi:hypothetical protein GCM10022212_12810 [Actimicrobium antarcticum]|uniref:Ice-binding protein C-terminal domain-containing protein n=1 Tax=Actimicrobium antarcticum TaxID=1051899 RepID=A0ABP7SYW6_9BURK